jgi:hypothetical protein
MARGNFGNRFWAGQFPRWAGAAAMLGGVLCVLAAILHNLEPVGCIGMDCETTALRSATGFVPVAAAAASLLILVGVAGLALLAQRSGQHLKLANAGLVAAAVGFILLFTGGLIQAAFFAGDFPGMPYFVIPGLLAVIAGFLMIGMVILRSGVLPRWLGIFFVVSTAALLAANEQTPAVLLAIPFGLAMVAAGYYMWAGAAAMQPPFPEAAT